MINDHFIKLHVWTCCSWRYDHWTEKEKPASPCSTCPLRENLWFWNELNGDKLFFFFNPVFIIIASWTTCSYMKFYETYPYDQQWSMITAWLRDCWSCMKSVDHSMKRLLIIHERLHIHIIMKIIVTPRFDPESSIYINCITKLFAIIAIINLQLAYQNCIWASKSGPRHIMLKAKSVGQSLVFNLIYYRTPQKNCA